jgi:hypothetical protein
MNKIFLGLAMGAISMGLVGCAAIPVLPSLLGLGDQPATLLNSTSVQQSQQNYRIIKTNAVGRSTGFKLLGIITFKSASYFKAMTQLYQDAGVAEGQAQALANVLHEKTSSHFILFSRPKVTIRADLIEFIDAGVTNKPSPLRLESP